MTTVAVVFAFVAIGFHVFVFWLESFAWTTPRVRALFGTTPETAETTRLLALNQGYYNLFLAIIVASGVAALLAGATTVGATLVVAGCGAMTGAGIVLALSRRSALRAGMVQALPAAAAVAVVLASVANSG